MTHKLVLCRVCVACDHKQPTGPKCSKCGGSVFDFTYCLVEVKKTVKKIPHHIRNSRQITLFDD